MDEHVWELETERLEQMAQQIKREMEKLGKVVEHRQSEALEIRRNFWDEVTVNTSDYTEIAETAASIRQQQAILSEQERHYQQAEQGLKKLAKLEVAPYFARVDFAEEGMSKEEIYIGIGSFVDEDTHALLIYDWRAPISSLFYDFTPGPAQYQTPIGEIKGQLSLKRQFLIKQGKLENMFDTGIQIGDEMLQMMLAKNAHEKMSHIVTSIQQEQNQIIRDEEHDILIVQGAAGSGKTSVALQRVAYLLYRFRNSLRSDNMVLFSPNSIFNDYVSNVLPELGEANLLQTTFQEHIEQQFEKVVQVEDNYDQLEYLLGVKESDPNYKIRLKGIEWKTSLSFMKRVDDYAEQLTKEGMLFHPFVLRERVLISEEQMQTIFYEQLAQEAWLPTRVSRLQQWIVAELQKWERRIQKRFYRKLRENPRYMGTESEMKTQSEQRATRIFDPLRRQANQLDFLNVVGMYQRFFTAPHLPSDYAAVGLHTIDRLSAGQMFFEDATPYMYLKQRMIGMDTINQIRHVIIDEAQDYSPFQLEYIRKLFPRAKFTILGDLNQGIFYANRQSYEQIEGLFVDQQVGIRKMMKSYRSTAEIVNFTRSILNKPEPIEAIGRHGEQPRIQQVAAEELPRFVAECVLSLGAAGAESIAIVCKTMEEAKQAFIALEYQLEQPIHLITKDTLEFKTGVTVIPAYLAKGLEFDGVIIYNAGRAIYEHDEDRKLLYTACTRALHFLRVFHSGERSPLLPTTEG
ncbi:hypothetical protein BEP19_08210 [Ammoniphilus oxalaticus]|uniref:UvrD-like helicase ATP-binding domain-containing protein n=1 Tax=Ammoniphilus oxalaticus TaxID=66863 RepID=A0A419SKD7_9BACL|nr:RNA polymerase recycling motor HelD [Ammoniphilus oxalaticus]RKD24368.1 hypothetical protein BEP19_08210 [Ammoniphilus oxalaticus]